VPAGEWEEKNSYGELIFERAHIPMSEYEKIRDRLNPVKFDAAEHSFRRATKALGRKGHAGTA